MSNEHELYLYEELMLLALRDEEGTILPGTMYQYGICGAIIAELLLEERIKLDERGRKPKVAVQSSTRLGDDLLDECLELISKSKRQYDLQYWVSRFVNKLDLKHLSLIHI